MAADGRRAKILAASGAIYLFWGSSNLALKIAMATVPPLLVGGLRLVTAGVLMTGFALARGHRLERQHWAPLVAAGALLFLGGHGGLYWGQKRLSSSVGALLLATMPLWVVVIEGCLPHGIRLGWRAVSGLTLGVLGVLLLVGPTRLLGLGRVDVAGATAVVLGTLSWAVGSVYSSRARLPHSRALAGGMTMISGGALLLAAAALGGELRGFRWRQVSAHSWMAMGYSTVFSSLVAFSCFLWLLRQVSPARVVTYAYVNPLVALALGWGFAGDLITARILGAIALLLAAVALIVAAPNKIARPPQPEAAAAP